MDAEILANLRNTLVVLYPDEPGIRRIIADSGINSARINFNTAAIDAWHSALVEAEKTDLVGTLLKAVEQEYGNNQEFRRGYDAYLESERQFRDKPKSIVESKKRQTLSWFAYITVGIVVLAAGVGVWLWSENPISPKLTPSPVSATTQAVSSITSTFLTSTVPTVAIMPPPGNCLTLEEMKANFSHAEWLTEQPITTIVDTHSAREYARNKKVKLFVWGKCVDEKIEFVLEMFPNSRQFGIHELETITITVTPNILRRAEDLVVTATDYLQYHGDKQVAYYRELAKHFGRLAEAIAPVPMPTIQETNICAEHSTAAPTLSLVPAEWAELTYLEATSYLFARDYQMAIARYDQIRQFYPALSMQAQNNRGLASINLAAIHWNSQDTNSVIHAEQEAQCAFAGIVGQAENRAGTEQDFAASQYLALSNWGMSALYAKLILLSAPGLEEQVIDTIEGIVHCEQAQKTGKLGDLCKAAHILSEAWLTGSTTRAKNLLIAEEFLGNYAEEPSDSRATIYTYWRGYWSWLTGIDETNPERKKKYNAAAVTNFEEFTCPIRSGLYSATDLFLIEVRPPIAIRVCNETGNTDK